MGIDIGRRQRRKISCKEITIHQATSTHHPMMSQTDYCTTTRQEERKDRLEFLNDKYNLDYYSDSDFNSEYEYDTFV